MSAIVKNDGVVAETNRLAQDGGRFPGPLFLQPAVQRVLREAGVLHLFNTGAAAEV